MYVRNKTILLIPGVKSWENIIGKLVVVRSNMNLCRSGQNITATRECIGDIVKDIGLYS